jgi:hypothetical protein
MPACRYTFLALSLFGLAIPVEAQDAQALRSRHAAMRAELADSPFGRPLHVESSESGSSHKGAVYAVVDEPFKLVGAALRDARQWCDVLVLLPNVKSCEASNADAEALSLFVARTPTDPLEEAYRTDFAYAVPAAASDYLHVGLGAKEGPFGTTDYRIRLEATPLDAQRTFLHLAYSYAVRGTARMGMQMYLATSGRNKVGFSVVDHTPDGRPVYVRGVRGVVERTTMRNYLALEAYLASLEAPPGERMERRLRAFHAGLERYPRQLHELELDEYLDIKRSGKNEP